MGDIYLHSRKLESVFELLGSNENDITCSTGWVLARSPAFLRVFLRRIFPKLRPQADSRVKLQVHDKSNGITDVEIFSPELHAIIEAKRGWTLPGPKQLNKYASRLHKSKSRRKVLVVTAECSAQYAKIHLPRKVKGISVDYLSWKDVHDLSRLRTGTHSEKHLVEELRSYLRRIVKMQNQESNMVFVVVLADEIPKWCTISRRDIVNKKRRYFHSFGRNGWPKEPPNYLGFRYDGKLQSIHHVESSKIVDELHPDIPEIEPGKELHPYILYKLGKPIKPPKEVRTGKIYRNGRVRAMLDLLLTCDTISQARDETNKRLSEME